MPTAVDLFCGAGGLSLGFEMAGFRVGAAIDADPVPAETYRLQNPDTPFLLKTFARSRASISGGQLEDR